jgi:hypothetical protein
MPSLLRVLVHDPDLPTQARAALLVAQATPPGTCQEAAKQRAAASLNGLYDLTAPEIAELVGLSDLAALSRPSAPALPWPCV